MKWPVEKDIRLETLRSVSDIGPSRFLEAYAALAKEPGLRTRSVRVEVA